MQDCEVSTRYLHKGIPKAVVGYPQCLDRKERAEAAADRRDLALAVSLLRENLTWCLKSLSKDPMHEMTVWHQEALASHLAQQGNFTEALVRITEAYENRYAVSPDGKDTLATLDQYASILGKLGRYRLAASKYKLVWEVQKKEFGENDPLTLTTGFELACCWFNLGMSGTNKKYNIARAKDLHRTILKAHELESPPDVFVIVMVRENLARDYLELGQYDTARELSRRNQTELRSLRKVRSKSFTADDVKEAERSTAVLLKDINYRMTAREQQERAQHNKEQIQLEREEGGTGQQAWEQAGEQQVEEEQEGVRDREIRRRESEREREKLETGQRDRELGEMRKHERAQRHQRDEAVNAKPIVDEWVREGEKKGLRGNDTEPMPVNEGNVGVRAGEGTSIEEGRNVSTTAPIAPIVSEPDLNHHQAQNKEGKRVQQTFKESLERQKMEEEIKKRGERLLMERKALEKAKREEQVRRKREREIEEQAKIRLAEAAERKRQEDLQELQIQRELQKVEARTKRQREMEEQAKIRLVEETETQIQPGKEHQQAKERQEENNRQVLQSTGTEGTATSSSAATSSKFDELNPFRAPANSASTPALKGLDPFRRSAMNVLGLTSPPHTPVDQPKRDGIQKRAHGNLEGPKQTLQKQFAAGTKGGLNMQAPTPTILIPSITIVESPPNVRIPNRECTSNIGPSSSGQDIPFVSSPPSSPALRPQNLAVNRQLGRSVSTGKLNRTAKSTTSAPIGNNERGVRERRNSDPNINERAKGAQKRLVPQPPVRKQSKGDSPYDADEEPFNDKSVDRWFRDLRAINETIFDPFRRNAGKRVKVAILDTGIDMNNNAFKDNQIRKRIKKRVDFVDRNGDATDTCGHGTHCAALLNRVAPWADIYVGRVAIGFEKGPDPDVVAKAIRRALGQKGEGDASENWDVDILSLSLGFRGYRKIIKAALDDTMGRGHGKLVVAAASNPGTRAKMAFPASAIGIIAVNSANGNGLPSEFNPPSNKEEKSLTILGEAVISAWTTTGSRDRAANPDATKRMSGTYVATPIAAGIMALILEAAMIDVPDEEDTKRILDEVLPWLRGYEGMMAVLMDRAVTTRHGYLNVVPQRLLDPTWPEERRINRIGNRLREILTDHFGDLREGP